MGFFFLTFLLVAYRSCTLSFGLFVRVSIAVQYRVSSKTDINAIGKKKRKEKRQKYNIMIILRADKNIINGIRLVVPTRQAF